MRMHIHLSETRKEVEDALAAWGQTPPERMQALGMLDFPIVAAHCVHLSDSDIALLDRPTFGIAHNPASNLKLQSGRAPIEKLVGRSLAVGLGSDGNGSNDIVDILKDIYLTAILHPWTEEQRPAHTTLAMATREGARAIGLDAQIGSIEVGKLADLILVDLDNRAHAASPRPALRPGLHRSRRRRAHHHCQRQGADGRPPGALDGRRRNPDRGGAALGAHLLRAVRACHSMR